MIGLLETPVAVNNLCSFGCCSPCAKAFGIQQCVGLSGAYLFRMDGSYSSHPRIQSEQGSDSDIWKALSGGYEVDSLLFARGTLRLALRPNERCADYSATGRLPGECTMENSCRALHSKNGIFKLS